MQESEACMYIDGRRFLLGWARKVKLELSKVCLYLQLPTRALWEVPTKMIHRDVADRSSSSDGGRGVGFGVFGRRHCRRGRR